MYLTCLLEDKNYSAGKSPTSIRVQIFTLNMRKPEQDFLVGFIN